MKQFLALLLSTLPPNIQIITPMKYLKVSVVRVHVYVFREEGVRLRRQSVLVRNDRPEM